MSIDELLDIIPELVLVLMFGLVISSLTGCSTFKGASYAHGRCEYVPKTVHKKYGWDISSAKTNCFVELRVNLKKPKDVSAFTSAWESLTFHDGVQKKDVASSE